MSAVYRVNVCVPEGGWITRANLEACPRALTVHWLKATAIAATAAKVPPMRQVAVRALVRDSSPGAGRRVVVAEDIRPSLEAALHGLVAAGVLIGSDRRYVVADVLELGPSTGDLEPLLTLDLTEVRGGG